MQDPPPPPHGPPLQVKPKKTEITEKLRTEINKVVNRYIDQVRTHGGRGAGPSGHTLTRVPRLCL